MLEISKIIVSNKHKHNLGMIMEKQTKKKKNSFCHYLKNLLCILSIWTGEDECTKLCFELYT